MIERDPASVALVSVMMANNETGVLQDLVQLPNTGLANAPGYGGGAGFKSYSKKPLRVDLGGIGVKLAVGIGL